MCIEPLAFTGAEFGVATGPIVYSNVDCGGWENGITECMKSSHLNIQCSHSSVAGVMCADGICDIVCVMYTMCILYRM